MKVSITHNKEKNGLEINFSQDLPKGFGEHLIHLGFKKSRTTDDVWYVRFSPAYENYAKALVDALNQELDPFSVQLKPSYETSLDNIDHNRFSRVTITYKDEQDSEEKKIHYVVFDALLRSATIMAERFAKEHYGDRLINVLVSARNGKVDSRHAFHEGRIITGESPSKPNPKEKTVTEQSTIRLTVEGLINDIRDLENQIEDDDKKNFTFSTRVRLEQALLLKKETAFITELKQIINELKAHKSISLSHGDLTKRFIEYINILANVLESEPLSMPTKTLTNENGVYTKETAGVRLEVIEIPIPKTAKFEAKIKVVHDEDDNYRFAISTQKNFGDVSGASSPVSTSSSVYKTRQEVLELAFKDIVFRIEQLIEKKDYIVSDQKKKNSQLNKALKATLSYAKELGVTIDEKQNKAQTDKQKDKQDTEIKGSDKWELNTVKLVQAWTKLDNTIIDKLEQFIQTSFNYLHFEYEKEAEFAKDISELTPSGFRILTDRDTINFIILENNTVAISSHNPLKESVLYGGSTMSTGKLKKAINYILKHPEKILVPEQPTKVEDKNKIPELEYLHFSKERASEIRQRFISAGFKVPFTGQDAFENDLPVFDLAYRWDKNWRQYEELLEAEQFKTVKELELERDKIKSKSGDDNEQEIKKLDKQIIAEIDKLEALLEDENLVFEDELFLEILNQVNKENFVLEGKQIIDFHEEVLPNLLEKRIVTNYPKEPIKKMVSILIDDYFAKRKTKADNSKSDPDYLDKVVSIMHDHYMNAKRLSKKQVEAVKEEAGVPNMGALWEAVELSWLLWYKFYYNQPDTFENRLKYMIKFWNTIQPTYAYSDSSKELYKQYSTPCPIGAMIAQYTNMRDAKSIFEPSAGNGLLVIGANPEKTHVNEIDKSRRHSLEVQGFKTITHLNAALSFPEELKHTFDVVVTNPPFAKWEDSKFDKERYVRKYFNNQRGLVQHMRLEHYMAGLALHTLKDNGKAAIIIMGHVYFDMEGYIAKYRPFFNWLYRHYKVEDIINMNSYKLYNKQGAVAKTMLILINGRKPNPSGVSPRKKDQPSLEDVVERFEDLWDRIRSHLSIHSPIKTLIKQLKIELGK